jgi:diguanylate cyclase (GGDEF)-like protein/PAS domain S-box-containing protein
MKSKALEYFDFEKANALLEAFNHSTDFVTAILDLEGNVLSKSGWRQICTDFHRVHPQSSLNCTISDTELANKREPSEKYHFYKCLNGLIDVQMPIVIRGEHVANLYSGQFFFEEPDIAFFKEQAENYGFDENLYFEALEKVPVVSKEKVGIAMNFLLDIIEMIIEMTSDKFEQIKLNEKIRESEKALLDNQAQLRKSEERFRVVQEVSPDGFTILHPLINELGEIIDFEFVFENQAIARVNQTDPNQIIGRRVLELFPAHSGSRLFEVYKQVANTRETQVLEEVNAGEIVSKPVWLRLVVVSMGEDIAILAQDITEQILAKKESEENAFRFLSLFNEMSAGAAIYKVLNDGEFGKDYIIRDFNKAALKAESKSKEEVIGKSLYDLRPNIDQYGLIPVFQSVWRTGEPAFYPSKVYVDDRFFNWYENRVSKLPTGEIVAIFEDVTERSLAEQALFESERKYSSYIENAPDGVFVVNDKGNYVDANYAATKITGYSRDELLKMSIRDLTPGELMNQAVSHFTELLEKGYSNGELQFIHKNGSLRWWSLDAVRLDAHRFLGFSRDIDDKKKAESEMLYLSYHDHLTGLYNRRFFEQELRRLDTIENLPISIIMFDVNGLKLVNDSFGHDAGDSLLKKAAEAINKMCRKEDMVARIGGDEFVLLLPKTSSRKCVEIANQIKELSSKEKVANIELSISYGYDTKEMDKQSILEIMANAENYMYRYKLFERSSNRSKTTDLIMNTLFEKSKREAAHSNRVSIICQTIASTMNMGKDVVNKLRIAGLIHDIGKIGVAESILNKSGILTTDERSEIERHPEIGWRLLSSTNEYSELAQLVLNHHEKWDGSGYPNRLKGEAIPLEARIIAVADAYDAMTSERSYREALSNKEAIDELVRGSGTQFDPAIIEMFINQVLIEKRL